MDERTQEFVGQASQVVAEAAADLGGLIAAPWDPHCAVALREKLGTLRRGALAAGLTELAGLAAAAEAPLQVAPTRRLDRASLQTVGWAVQSLDGALAAARAPAAVAV
jgi:hypothetical protein